MNGVCSRYVENGSPKERSAVRRACPIMVTVCSGSFSEARVGHGGVHSSTGVPAEYVLPRLAHGSRASLHIPSVTSSLSKTV